MRIVVYICFCFLLINIITQGQQLQLYQASWRHFFFTYKNYNTRVLAISVLATNVAGANLLAIVVLIANMPAVNILATDMLAADVLTIDMPVSDVLITYKQKVLVDKN